MHWGCSRKFVHCLGWCHIMTPVLPDNFSSVSGGCNLYRSLLCDGRLFLCPRQFEGYLPKMTLDAMSYTFILWPKSANYTCYPPKIVMLFFKGVFCLQIESDIREFVWFHEQWSQIADWMCDSNVCFKKNLRGKEKYHGNDFNGENPWASRENASLPGIRDWIRENKTRKIIANFVFFYS